MFQKLFLIITLIALCTNVYGEQNQKISISALKFVQLKTDYVIDDVLALLESFEKGIDEQITNLQESIIETIKSMDLRISGINEVRDEKQKKCTEHQQAKDELEAELAKLNHYIDWIQKRIEKDQKEIVEIQERRCLTHEIYIKYVMDAKLLLRLIVFLRAAIEKYSFAEIQQVNNILSKYMKKELMNNHDALKLMFAELGIIDYKKLEERQRTDEEIGTGHIDNGGDQISVQQFRKTSRQTLEDYKTELIGICNSLEELIKNQMSSRQDDEVDLNDQIVKYLTLLDAEILQLQKQLVQQQTQQEGLLFQIEGKNHLIEWCDGELQQLNAEIKKTQDFIESYKADQLNFKEQLSKQIDIIGEIKTIYIQYIHGVAEEYKGRTDDYIYSASFDGTAKFDARELNENYGDKATTEALDARLEELTTKAFEQ